MFFFVIIRVDSWLIFEQTGSKSLFRNKFIESEKKRAGLFAGSLADGWRMDEFQRTKSIFFAWRNAASPPGEAGLRATIS